MDEDFLKEVASQLRKPSGELGNEIALRMNEGNREMNLGTIELLGIAPGDHVLEVGMGNGFFVKDILSSADDVTYTGCDYSEDMIRLAQKENKEFIEAQKAAFIHCEGHNLPVEDCSTDKLFTINTIYFWDDIPATLNEFRRVLKPKGILAITIRPGSSMKRYPTTKYGFNFFEIDDIEQLVKNAGFEVSNSIQVTEQNEVEIFGNTFKTEYAVVMAVSEP